MEKVALEEHFMIDLLVPYMGNTLSSISQDVASRGLAALKDFGDQRIAAMDAGGIDMAILSLSGRGVQNEPDRAVASRLAKRCNDMLAVEIQGKPKRYGGLAHLPMQDPAGAADELERCVTELGFHGGKIHGQTFGVYLDDPRYEAFWERAAAIQAPIYLHPTDPATEPVVFEGRPELLGPVWSWTVETSAHALRLVIAGVFERHPRAQIILGHMGECLPFHLWRFDRRYAVADHAGYTLPQPPSFYIRRNVAITTAGVCDDAALLCSIAALGEERVLFSVDYPFEDCAIAGAWADALPVDEALRAKICRGNAEALLRLPPLGP